MIPNWLIVLEMGGSTTKPRSPQFKTKPFFFVSEVAPSWPSRLVALFVAATRDAWSGVLICNSWLTGSLVSSGGVGWPWSHKRKRIHIWISKILSMDWFKGKSTGNPSFYPHIQVGQVGVAVSHWAQPADPNLGSFCRSATMDATVELVSLR